MNETAILSQLSWISVIVDWPKEKKKKKVGVASCATSPIVKTHNNMNQPESTEMLRSQLVVNSRCGFSQSQTLVAASSLNSRIKVGARSDLMKVYLWGAHDLPQQTTTTALVNQQPKVVIFFSASFDPFSSRGTAGRFSRAPKTLLIAVVSLKCLKDGWRSIFVNGASRFGAADCKRNCPRSLKILYFWCRINKVMITTTSPSNVSLYLWFIVAALTNINDSMINKSPF